MKTKVHIIANNHIDREWTYDAQLTRMITVKFFEDLITTFEAIPDFQFVLDSQTVPLEDYLEICPESRPLLEKYVEDKRLWVGPWYTAPDCFYLTGESIVRNLLVGHRVAREFGSVSKFGYTPFGWGQISQLPQIYDGFGIDSVFFYRGADTIKPNYYDWVGADGTAARCIKYHRTNFFDKVFRPTTKKREAIPWDRELNYSGDEVPFMFSGEEYKYEHGFVAAGKFDIKSDDVFMQKINEFVDGEKTNFPGDIVLGMNGMDTCFPSFEGLMAVEKIKTAGNDSYDLVYSSLDAFSDELKKAVSDKAIELENHHGEMRHFLPGFGGPLKPEAKTTHFYIAAARPKQKSKNAKAENLLSRYAEPIAAMSWVLGKEYPDSYLTTAWKHLLKCHPHDTIAGCGSDHAEIDMLNRLDQTINISKAVMNMSAQHIVTSIDNSDVKDDEIALVVFNQSAFARKEAVPMWLHISEHLGFDKFEIVEKKSGKALDFAIVSRGEKEDRIFRALTDTSLYLHGELIKVNVEVDVPALGYKTLLVRKSDTSAAAASMKTADNAMENDFIKVAINGDGTLNVTNKQSGKCFENLHYFTDTGDNGDPWVRFVPDENKMYCSKGTQAKVSTVEDSALRTAFEIEYNFMIPEGLIKKDYNMEGFFNVTRSSDVLIPLKIKSVVSITKDSKYVDVNTEIDNQSTDHLVQVNFPSMLNTDKIYADSGFDVVERTIVKNTDNNDPGLINGEDPFIRFVDISDGKDGFAVLSDSVKGYEPNGDAENSFALNLIRAYTSQIVTIYGRKERRPDFPLTQAQGIHNFHYAIYPHSGNWENGCTEQAEYINCPMMPTQTHRSFGTLPSEMSFITETSGKLVLSAVKKADCDDALIVRLYNPLTVAVTGGIELFKNVKKAELVNLNEETKGDAKFAGNKVTLDVEAKKIVTCKVYF